MFKINFRLVMVLTILSIFTLPFQNCSQDGFVGSANLNSELAPIMVVDTVDPDTTVDPTLVAKTETLYEPLLADRIYLNALFKDIFGDTAVSVDTTHTVNNAIDHGSPCSAYEDYNAFDSVSRTYVRADIRSPACDVRSAAHLVSEINPKTTVTRQALITRACSDLTSNARTLSVAIQRISPATGVPTPTAENLTKMVKLFYRGKPAPSTGIIQSLSAMFPESAVTSQHWAAAIYTVCTSSYWQVL